jgi:predicted double-glycine peptidase
MGIQGSQVELYDPWEKTVKISLEEFRSNFDLMLQKP